MARVDQHGIEYTRPAYLPDREPDSVMDLERSVEWHANCDVCGRVVLRAEAWMNRNLDPCLFPAAGRFGLAAAPITLLALPCGHTSRDTSGLDPLFTVRRVGLMPGALDPALAALTSAEEAIRRLAR